MALDPKELWVGWTRDASAKYERPEELDDDEVAGDMVDFTTAYADMMLEEYEGFSSSGRKTRSKKKRKKAEEPDDDDDDDDEDSDD